MAIEKTFFVSTSNLSLYGYRITNICDFVKGTFRKKQVLQFTRKTNVFPLRNMFKQAMNG